MQNKLLPCPFCGGEAELYQHYPYMQRRVVSAVHCKKCRANSGTWGRKDKAIETWNTRKPMERILEQLEETVAKRIAWIGMKDSWCDAIEKAIDIVRNGGKE